MSTVLTKAEISDVGVFASATHDLVRVKAVDGMDFSEVLHTTGAVRTFAPEPVSAETLYRVLDAARFAPSGGNRQPWHVIIVKDTALRSELAELSTQVFRRYVTEQMAGYQSFSVVNPAPIELPLRDDLPAHPMLSAIGDVPEVLVVTVDLRDLAVLDRNLERPSIVGGGSIYPFIQNLLLAARNEGLGACLTTFLAAAESRAAQLLDLPEEHAIAALIGLGFPREPFKRLKRKSVEEFATTDRFDGQPFTSISAG